jgi:hypothetical protein
VVRSFHGRCHAGCQSRIGFTLKTNQTDCALRVSRWHDGKERLGSFFCHGGAEVMVGGDFDGVAEVVCNLSEIIVEDKHCRSVCVAQGVGFPPVYAGSLPEPFETIAVFLHGVDSACGLRVACHQPGFEVRLQWDCPWKACFALGLGNDDLVFIEQDHVPLHPSCLVWPDARKCSQSEPDPHHGSVFGIEVVGGE